MLHFFERGPTLVYLSLRVKVALQVEHKELKLAYIKHIKEK
jgi:hypothetical protein